MKFIFFYKKHFSWNPIHPRRDWQYLLIAFTVSALAIGAWSGYLFLVSTRLPEDVAGSKVEDHGTTLQVERISAFFEGRTPAVSIDPSF